MHRNNLSIAVYTAIVIAMHVIPSSVHVAFVCYLTRSHNAMCQYSNSESILQYVVFSLDGIR